MPLRAIHDIPAPAKLNLFLHVVGRRGDGYHLLQSVFVPIDWCDTLHVERRDDGRIARHDLTAVLPVDDLCLRAARALQAASGTSHGVDLSIDKRIPSGAGMGGGSSDAASTLLALNRLWGLHWTVEQLLPLALGLGADVPFFLGAGPALIEGIGERSLPLALEPEWFAVIKPAAGLETRAIFQSPLLGRSPEGDPAAIIEGFARSRLSRGPESDLSAAHRRNDLQAAAEAICPEVARAAAWLQTRFGNSRMTGSGSAIFARAGQGDRPGQALPEQLPAGWTGRMCRSLAVHPLAGWAD